MLHVRPVQQSPVLVQAPPLATQVVVPQRSTPWASGTHAAPSQHSLEKVQRLADSTQQGRWPV
jgi:hypothetical protein